MWNRILQVFVNRPDDKHYKSILWISQLGKGQLDRPQHCTTLWAEIGRAGRTSDMNPPAVLETSIHQGRLSPSIGELSLATFFWDKCYIYTLFLESDKGIKSNHVSLVSRYWIEQILRLAPQTTWTGKRRIYIARICRIRTCCGKKHRDMGTLLHKTLFLVWQRKLSTYKTYAHSKA